MSWNRSFELATSPKVIFGRGQMMRLPAALSAFGSKILLVTGERSLVQSEHWPGLLEALAAEGRQWEHYQVAGEPSPMVIDRAVEQTRGKGVEAVVGIGGGSVLDAGKAIAALLCEELPIKHFLEGVGDRKPSGRTLPFIAVPTTAGTGSEATKNAVLSEVGEQGYKKSLRHDHFVPKVAIIDPLLMLHCPRSITACSGMDAFTQLLEAYLSTQSNPLTDTLALAGLQEIATHLEVVVEDGENLEARAGMAYAALLSGLCLANAGLGTVHGFASSVGARISIPHGALCGSLMGICNRVTVAGLSQDDVAWHKYEQVGRLFLPTKNQPTGYYVEGLLEKIDWWIEAFALPHLSDFGLQMEEIPNIAAQTSNKFNPVQLSEEDRQFILQTRL